MGGFVSSTSIPTFTVPNGIPAQGSMSASASVDPFGQTLKTSVTINPASGGNAQPFGNASAYLDYYFEVHKEYDYLSTINILFAGSYTLPTGSFVSLTVSDYYNVIFDLGREPINLMG